MAGGGIKISNIKVNGGADGATFIPSVSSDGVLSWTNNKGYTNPTSVNIKGADGKDGKDGVNGANIVSTVLQGQDANGGNIYKQTFSNGATANFTAPRGAMGATGAKGDKGDSGNPQGNILQTTGTSVEDTMSQNAITEELANVERVVASGANYICYASGLKIQWGEMLTPSYIEPGGVISPTVSLPIAMSKASYSIAAISANSRVNLGFDNVTTSSFWLWIRNLSTDGIPTNTSCDWIVIGY